MDIHCASCTADQSTNPKTAAMLYQTTIPFNIDIIIKNTLKVTQQTIMIKSIKKETITTIGSMDQLAPASSGAIRPAISAATGTNSRPITATMAPIAAGGNNISIQAVPTSFTIKATRDNTIPTAKKPPNT